MNEDESYIKRYGTTIEKYNLACTKAVEYTQVRYREGYRAGIEAVLKFFEEGDESTMWRVYEITDAIERILEAQIQEDEK